MVGKTSNYIGRKGSDFFGIALKNNTYKIGTERFKLPHRFSARVVTDMKNRNYSSGANDDAENRQECFASERSKIPYSIENHLI